MKHGGLIQAWAGVDAEVHLELIGVLSKVRKQIFWMSQKLVYDRNQEFEMIEECLNKKQLEFGEKNKESTKVSQLRQGSRMCDKYV